MKMRRKMQMIAAGSDFECESEVIAFGMEWRILE